MIVRIEPRRFSGTVRIPASKSHTIRQLLIASLADGVSEIINPLDSLDTRSCVNACRNFGAQIEEYQDNSELIKWTVSGQGTRDEGRDMLLNKNPVPVPRSPLPAIDAGNSGTTLYLALAVAGLYNIPFQFTGDEQIQKRSAAPLLEALERFGVNCTSKNGCVPITIKGPWKGGKAVLPCPTSQYLSAILIAAPLAPAGTVTEVEVPILNEKPYIEMTLSYLKKHNIKYETNFIFDADAVPCHFIIPGGQSWKPFPGLYVAGGSVPADFSSAAFPAAAAAITGGEVTLLGLDPEDTQGDKFFLEILREMGCEVKWETVNQQPRPEGRGIKPLSTNKNGAAEKTVTISRSKPLKGGTFDLNKTPDLLPAAAAVAAFAEGDTALVNVAHARIKETDRITVMKNELAKLGVKCTERKDGLIVHGKGSLPVSKECLQLSGHGDHRIVMALAVAALGGHSLGLSVPVEIDTAEAAAVTYPGFLELIGAHCH